MSQQHTLLRSRENSAYKLKGAGDGYTRTPSARKTSRDAVLQLPLKKITAGGETVENGRNKQQQQLVKAKSVAEITPTKSKNRTRIRESTTNCNLNMSKSSVTLHATPRPLTDGVAAGVDEDEATSRRHRRLAIEKEHRLIGMVYQRMLLLSWRRNKRRLATLSDSLKRRQDQLANLEKQVDCLKDLTQSECAKRNEAINNHSQMKNLLESEQHKNELLEATKTSLQIAVKNLEDRVQVLSGELKHANNDMETRMYKMRAVEMELEVQKSVARKLSEELKKQMNQKMNELEECESAKQSLRELLKNTENRLENATDQITTLNQQVDTLSESYTLEISENAKLHEEIAKLREEQSKLLREIEQLDEKCDALDVNYLATLQENKRLKDFHAENELNKQCLWGNVKDFMAVSWMMLQNAAYIMLPAL